MARMTYDQKHARASARWWGKDCLSAIDRAVFHGREAASWRAIDGHDGMLTTMWQERSDKAIETAVECAVRAAHWAHQSMPAAERSERS